MAATGEGGMRRRILSPLRPIPASFNHYHSNLNIYSQSFLLCFQMESGSERKPIPSFLLCFIASSLNVMEETAPLLSPSERQPLYPKLFVDEPKAAVATPVVRPRLSFPPPPGPCPALLAPLLWDLSPCFSFFFLLFSHAFLTMRTFPVGQRNLQWFGLA